ncbi:hypothetical protein P0W64_09685 [Tsukamurella sp. 8F]|uniref:hypothetical protein n=1 Tax=unclassified Tsukamurella TaxID=2633480 RepID=UPI0023B8EF3D|nr:MULTISPECIES: hypothetical protein [unclassified Tsukamurella]MDF0529850.1 hypothetical protein [Tsukamurella sp. 8J]MDF0587042.1 hypothetical protein [Tsukamurella sp. 8F]
MRATRAALGTAGLGALAYGGWLAAGLPPGDLVSAALWAAAALALHDGVFAPVCLLAGHTSRRLLPPRWWAAALAAGVLAVTIAVLATPVTRGSGRPPNGTVLDRPYGISLGVAAVCVALAALGARLATRIRR